MELVSKTIGNKYKSRLFVLLKKHRKEILSMNVMMILKVFATLMQGKEKLCECHGIFFFFFLLFRDLIRIFLENLCAYISINIHT